MKRRLRSAFRLFGASLCVLVVRSAPAAGQDANSAALAKQLAGALDQAKLESVAAKLGDAPDAFAAALYFSGSELLVVSARYSAPSLLVDKIEKKAYRDVYLDLNGAPLPDSKVFIEDLGADGLKERPESGQPSDTYEAGKVRVSFDGEAKKQKMSDEEYAKAYSRAEADYVKILSALLANLKKIS